MNILRKNRFLKRQAKTHRISHALIQTGKKIKIYEETSVYTTATNQTTHLQCSKTIKALKLQIKSLKSQNTKLSNKIADLQQQLSLTQCNIDNTLTQAQTLIRNLKEHLHNIDYNNYVCDIYINTTVICIYAILS